VSLNLQHAAACAGRFPDRPQPNAHASLNDGEFPTLGNGRPRAFNPPGVRPPPRGGNGTGMQNGGYPNRGPSVAPPSHGGASVNGGAPASADRAHASAAPPLGTASEQEADEAAQLAAALAASKLDQGPDCQPPASVASAAPSGAPFAAGSAQHLRFFTPATSLPVDACS